MSNEVAFYQFTFGQESNGGKPVLDTKETITDQPWSFEENLGAL